MTTENDQSASYIGESIANLSPEEAKEAVAQAVKVASSQEAAEDVVVEAVKVVPEEVKKEVVAEAVQALPDDALDAKKAVATAAVQALPDDATDAKKEIAAEAVQALPDDAIDAKMDIAVAALQSLPQDAREDLIRSLTGLTTEAKDELHQRSKSDDPVPIHQDRPADVDELGREPFAHVLATRIRRIREVNDQSSFVLHIYGPWGSGKSTLLYFLRSELKKEADLPSEEDHSSTALMRSPWIVIEFNAWQHQRVGLPWWWLLDSVFHEGVRQLWAMQRKRSLILKLRDRSRAVRLIVEESIWRFFRAGRAIYLLALLVLTCLFALGWILGAFGLFFQSNLEKISAILTIITGSWAAILGLGRSLLPASARAAKNFMETTHDPMDALTRHFKSVVDRLGKNYPVAIFIDDLDRCQDTYVVDLLEGIQTLFREAPVTYAVAADRRWICTSYERRYEEFTDQVTEPGRPLGYLFLEKTFQLSVPVPHMSPADQADYLRSLLGSDRSKEEKERATELEKARREAQQKLRGLRTAEEIRTAVRNSPDDPISQQAFRAAAADRLGGAEVEAHREHFLQPFARLLEPNPRAMKRLVNAYGVRSEVDVLAGGNIDTGQLALFTILDLRWPLLAEYLAEHPERVEDIGKNNVLNGVPADLQALFNDQAVQDVIEGKGVVEKPLDQAAIRACVLIAPNSPLWVR